MPSTSNPTYIVLFILATVFSCPFLTCTGWFFFDGIVTYPRQQERWQAYDQITREHVDDPSTAAKAWEELAVSNGWPTEKPVEKTDADILTQYILGGVCSLFSLSAAVTAVVFGLLLLRNRGAKQTTAAP